jgi:malate/lactate dehydrogenase
MKVLILGGGMIGQKLAHDFDAIIQNYIDTELTDSP